MQTNIKQKLPEGLLLLLVVFVVFAFRRPDQLLNPYMWVEEGTVFLPQYNSYGSLSLFAPVSGYLVIPAKIIFIIATKMSFLHQPDISYWLTYLFTFGVVASIAFSPLQLKSPTLCAIATLLIPTDSEVFAVSEYVFWWSSLLCVVPLLWTENDKDEYPKTRVLMVLVGGLSSPIIVGLSTLYALRLWRYRTYADVAAFVASLAASVIQIVSILYAGNLSRSPGVKLDVLLVLEKFFGYFIYMPIKNDILWESVPLCLGLGLCLFLIIIIASFYYRQTLDYGYWLLLGCLLLVIVTSVSRISVDFIHPTIAGPRYFFFPYIFLSWILIQLANSGRTILRIAVSLVFVLSLRQTISYGQRFHDKIDWKSEVLACAGSELYDLPVHYDGNRERVLHLQLSGAVCRDLIKQSIYDSSVEISALNK